MVDRFGRPINYLRISVTDRCNLRCRYCMPPEGVTLLRHNDILAFEEIFEVARTAVSMGVTKLRITGGEPLIRRDIAELVRELAGINGVEDLSLSTNGVFLAENARALAHAGLQRVNVSLDAIDPERYREITRGGDVALVLKGIEAARDAGLEPVKLNCVVNGASSEQDASEVTEFAAKNGLEVRFIRRMDFPSGTFSVVDGGSGGDCVKCTRLRLSSDGFIRPCLFSGMGFSVRDLGPRLAIEEAVRLKPESGEPCSGNVMSRIGG